MKQNRFFTLFLALTATAFASGVTVRFDPSSTEVGPFPTDALTVVDWNQKTGRRINLPVPDCAVQVSACAQTKILNEYDGFNLNPMLQVRFSAPVDLDSLRRGVFLVALENMTFEESGTSYAGTPIPINQLIWDPATFTLRAKPDNVLDQHRRYALIVTSAVRDARGDPVEADPAFLQCLNRPSSAYCGDLAGHLSPLFALGEWLGGAQRIVSASIFTTLSATVWLERARDLLPLTPPAVRPTGTRSVFPAADISRMVFRQHNRVSPAGFNDAALDVSRLSGLQSLAFGSYQSPNYLVEQETKLWAPNRFQMIASVPTAVPMSPPARTEEVFFTAALPSTPKPAAGYPVVILVHGSPGVKTNFIVNGLSQSMAAEGYATVAISSVGNGFGPESRLVITERNGTVTELTAGGRTTDINGDGNIANGESCGLNRDCIRQTVVDLMQLVKVIQAGIDLDGDRSNDLDAGNIHLFGSSYGAFVGTLLTAVDPAISSATLSVGGGTIIDALRWSPLNRPGLNSTIFGTRTPKLEPNKGDQFEDEYVLRDQPVKVVTLPGAIQLQNAYETIDWLSALGDPLMYATHFRASTLPGVPIKRVMFIISRGDQQVVNPAGSAWIRAAHMREWTVLYRHDLARDAFPALPANGHPYINPGTVPASVTVALSAQRLAALFYATGRRCSLDQPCIPDVNDLVLPVFGKNLFEIPEALPEDLGFLP